MGESSPIKDFFFDKLGLETKQDKQAREARPKEQRPTSEEEKKNKETKWKDANDPFKFVVMGGKVQCAFCSSPTADIIVTANDISMQDKPWATTGDSDGKVNFAFTGVCNHPSQKKPMAPPPPCMAVISLGQWKDYSDTKVNDDNALLMKSKIPCMVSGQDLTITDSGQKTTLSEIEPAMNRKPHITSMEWINEEGKKTEGVCLEKGKAFLKVKTRDFTDKRLQVELRYKEGAMFPSGEEAITLEGEINTEGIAILAPRYNDVSFNKDED